MNLAIAPRPDHLHGELAVNLPNNRNGSTATAHLGWQPYPGIITPALYQATP